MMNISIISPYTEKHVSILAVLFRFHRARAMATTVSLCLYHFYIYSTLMFNHISLIFHK